MSNWNLSYNIHVLLLSQEVDYAKSWDANKLQLKQPSLGRIKPIFFANEELLLWALYYRGGGFRMGNAPLESLS